MFHNPKNYLFQVLKFHIWNNDDNGSANRYMSNGLYSSCAEKLNCPKNVTTNY